MQISKHSTQIAESDDRIRDVPRHHRAARRVDAFANDARHRNPVPFPPRLRLWGIDETHRQTSVCQSRSRRRQLVKLAAGIEPVQDGRIRIEKINAPFLYPLEASGPEIGAGIKFAVERGWLELHESGT
ncbi:hypothetical protein [Bradyrhizobium sp. UFLA05-109]